MMNTHQSGNKNIISGTFMGLAAIANSAQVVAGVLYRFYKGNSLHAVFCAIS
jgi:hypothetical protein